jgi:hypothetical protein
MAEERMTAHWQGVPTMHACRLSSEYVLGQYLVHTFSGRKRSCATGQPQGTHDLEVTRASTPSAAQQADAPLAAFNSSQHSNGVHAPKRH